MFYCFVTHLIFYFEVQRRTSSVLSLSALLLLHLNDKPSVLTFRSVSGEVGDQPSVRCLHRGRVSAEEVCRHTTLSDCCVQGLLFSV